MLLPAHEPGPVCPGSCACPDRTHGVRHCLEKRAGVCCRCGAASRSLADTGARFQRAPGRDPRRAGVLSRSRSRGGGVTGSSRKACERPRSARRRRSAQQSCSRVLVPDEVPDAVQPGYVRRTSRRCALLPKQVEQPARHRRCAALLLRIQLQPQAGFRVAYTFEHAKARCSRALCKRMLTRASCGPEQNDQVIKQNARVISMERKHMHASNPPSHESELVDHIWLPLVRLPLPCQTMFP